MRVRVAHRHEADDERSAGKAALLSDLIVSRDGSRACLRDSTRVSDATYLHIEKWLDWLITTGVRQAMIGLASTDQIDARLLRALGRARARLREVDADLIVTAQQ